MEKEIVTHCTECGVKKKTMEKEIKLNDKVEAIVEILHLLDKKLTDLNNRFNKLMDILGYKVK